MGTIATIYGCIFCYGGPRREELARTNEEALRSLPEEDRYPPLTRNMFALTATDYPQPGFYKYQMIHFGASLKEDGEEWDVWLKKFERLLARLEWDKAELHLSLEVRGRFDYTWIKPPDQAVQFSGGPRYFGARRLRYLEWVPAAEEELRLRPEDASLMARLVYAYQRIDEDDKARHLFDRLLTLDPEQAKTVEWI